MKKILEYLTNNEHRSRHEKEFDAYFFMSNFLALLIGLYCFFVGQDKYGWMCELFICFNWQWDNLRHNR